MLIIKTSSKTDGQSKINFKYLRICYIIFLKTHTQIIFKSLKDIIVQNPTRSAGKPLVLIKNDRMTIGTTALNYYLRWTCISGV